MLCFSPLNSAIVSIFLDFERDSDILTCEASH